LMSTPLAHRRRDEGKGKRERRRGGLVSAGTSAFFNEPNRKSGQGWLRRLGSLPCV
jgi:hypothetical protein